MNTLIRFPFLGLDLNPGKSVEIFGINIAFYGICIATAVLVGALIAYSEARRTKQSVDDYIDFTFFVMIFSIIGARLYYCIFEWDYYGKNPIEIITGFRNGGLAIYGGVIAAVITLYVFAKVKKMKFWLMADTAVLGLVIGQAIGRWGNFFNREAYGDYCNNFLAMQIPTSEAAHVTDTISQNITYIDGNSFIQVHPTFLYESLWNIGVFALLMFMRKRKKFDGQIFALYLIGYGLGRSWIEGLRTDQLKLGDFAVSQVLSIVLVIVAIICVVIKLNKLKNETKQNETKSVAVEAANEAEKTE